MIASDCEKNNNNNKTFIEKKKKKKKTKTKKKKKKQIKTKRFLNHKVHSLHIFSANQCIVLLFKNTVNCAHGVHTCMAPGYHHLIVKLTLMSKSLR